ncbi:MAG: ribonuclease P [Candidatus Aenigmarchaeota archaeon]|nr:ribonuclease P [Candidatus Aenigmarchaeota archaeon]
MIPGWMKRIARERISILLKLAEREVSAHKERSKRYVELARKIGMRYKVRLPKKYKRKICKSCNAYLKPGVNCTVRLVPKERCVVWRCVECGRERRYPYAKRKQ